MTPKQFAWAHMIYVGRANVQPSYYGGFDAINKSIPEDTPSRGSCFPSYNQWHIDRIREIGIELRSRETKLILSLKAPLLILVVKF